MVQLLVGKRALLIFRGPDGYVSPRWYDHENVPTWDYKFVHLTGIPQSLEREELKNHVLELVDHELQTRDEYVEKYLDDIRGFVVADPQVQPVFKLSQDKNAASINGVVAGLCDRGDQSLAEAIDGSRYLGQQAETTILAQEDR